MRFLSIACIVVLPSLASAQSSDGVLMRCGASTGHSFVFKGLFNPEGPNWTNDGISNGKIVLIRLGDEWDIQFDDIVGAFSYRQDGAQVFPLLENENILTVGAFGASFVDIYTFDFTNKVVGWTSNKHGPIVARTAAYSATCD